METPVKKNLAWALLSVFLTILFSCSTGTSHKVLTFFFDGVPQPDTSKQIQKDSLAVQSAQPAQAKKRQSRFLQENFFHPPYKDKECGDCHDTEAGFKLIDPLPELCFNCHDDFREELQVVHGPVASGACTECHHPHLAKNKMLLKRTGQELCLYCHDKADVLKNDAHEDLGDENCTDCHNAHGGEDEYFLE